MGPEIHQVDGRDYTYTAKIEIIVSSPLANLRSSSPKTDSLLSNRLPPIGHFFSSTVLLFLCKMLRRRLAKGSKTASMAVAKREREREDIAA